jgi:KipI family sensor histidine kinase inhibitor
MAHAPKFLAAGDRAITVELGNTVDEETNELVVALDRALAVRAIAGIVETVPTYRSLLVIFDPAIISRRVLRDQILACWPPAATDRVQYRRWTIPVLYGGDAGEDLEFVAKTHGLSPSEVVRIHASAEYHVYMIGFAPGFAYLGGLPERIQTSRRVEPRPRIPPSSVSIGGKQAAVCPPIELPSGWQLLGRTPVRTYDPGRQNPFLLEAGDRVIFEPISPEDFASLSARAEGGDPIARLETING